VVVAIAGAHGNIAMRLTRLLVAGGDEVVGLIRNPEHAADVREAGATPVVCDLEQASVEEVGGAITGSEAAVFAAGAGPGSGAERKLTVDRDGAVKLLQAATSIGARRYVIVSSVGAEDPPGGDNEFSVYLRAKAEADGAVRVSDRDWTIVRPGRLTDEPGTGRVAVAAEPFSGEVPRDDVAAVLARVLHDPRAVHRVLYVNGGDHQIDETLDAVLSSAVS
jgi:nucleoside-diphosphate-sugar epimerase